MFFAGLATMFGMSGAFAAVALFFLYLIFGWVVPAIIGALFVGAVVVGIVQGAREVKRQRAWPTYE